MKSVYLLAGVLIVLLLMSCGNDSNKTSTAISRVTDTFYLCDRLVEKDTIVKAEFENAGYSGYYLSGAAYDTSEPRNILIDSAVVRRRGDSLILSINGKVITLVNNSSDNSDSFAHYTYLGFNSEIGQYVVYGSFWEWDNYLLFDKVTADTTVTIGYPVVSPDKKYFICGNSDLVAQFTFNGLELYENSQKPKLLCQRELHLWGPNEIRWTAKNELVVKADVFKDTTQTYTRTTYYKLRLK